MFVKILYFYVLNARKKVMLGCALKTLLVILKIFLLYDVSVVNFLSLMLL